MSNGNSNKDIYKLTFFRSPLVPGFWPSNGAVATVAMVIAIVLKQALLISIIEIVLHQLCLQNEYCSVTVRQLLLWRIANERMAVFLPIRTKYLF